MAAEELCKNVYNLSSLSSLAYIDFIKLTLEKARNFFEEQGALKELGWCQACSVATDLRMQRLKLVKPPTLCKLSHLPAGLAAARRFRARKMAVDVPSISDKNPQQCPYHIDMGG